MNPRVRAAPLRRSAIRRRVRGPIGSAGRQQPLYRADDNGDGVRLVPRLFGGTDLEGWGRSFESFQRLNEHAFKALAVTPRFESTPRGPELKLYPGGRLVRFPYGQERAARSLPVSSCARDSVGRASVPF
jgi:hypothetical protein